MPTRIGLAVARIVAKGIRDFAIGNEARRPRSMT
jgi:hypothetical protein